MAAMGGHRLDMQVRIRYYAALREAVGAAEEALDLPDGATVAQARALLSERQPALAALLPACAAAVNRGYAPADAPLSEGAELVFIPPLGGG
ncbi:MAG: MoaD/ThiS family protein [Ktedonobacterales bacterium]